MIFELSRRCASGAALAWLMLAGAATTTWAEDKPSWVPISRQVTEQVKPGYPGKTAGITVDPATGDVFLVVPDQGIWKSGDHGQTFARADEGAIGGRCETGFALDFDPAGKRLMCFMIYGSSGLTSDGGKTWTASKTSHLDFGAVDWAATGKCMLALRHESGGQLCFTADGRKPGIISAQALPRLASLILRHSSPARGTD